MKRFLMVSIFLWALSAGNFAVAQLYVTSDDLSKHHLCLKNPYDSYMTGDQNTAWPNCYTNYAVVHIPTYQAEIAKLGTTIQLDKDGLNAELVVWGFGFSMFWWSIGQVAQVVLSILRKIRI